jgi:hypothetical protein
MKKTALALTIVSGLIVSLVVGAQFVSLVEANPYMMYHGVDPIPGTIPPPITISSPKNYTAYSHTAFNFTIKVDKPQPPVSVHETGILRVVCTLDGIDIYDLRSWFDPLPEVNYSKVLYELPYGDHELVVHVESVVDLGNLEAFFPENNSTVFFSIDSADYSAAPTTSPSPSPFPTTTAIPGIMLNIDSFSTALVVASASVMAVIVGIGLRVYFKKRHKLKNA